MLKRRWKVVRGMGMDDLKERVPSGCNMTDKHELMHAQSLHRLKPDRVPVLMWSSGHNLQLLTKNLSPINYHNHQFSPLEVHWVDTTGKGRWHAQQIEHKVTP